MIALKEKKSSYFLECLDSLEFLRHLPQLLDTLDLPCVQRRKSHVLLAYVPGKIISEALLSFFQGFGCSQDGLMWLRIKEILVFLCTSQLRAKLDSSCVWRRKSHVLIAYVPGKIISEALRLFFQRFACSQGSLMCWRIKEILVFCCTSTQLYKVTL